MTYDMLLGRLRKRLRKTHQETEGKRNRHRRVFGDINMYNVSNSVGGSDAGTNSRMILKSACKALARLSATDKDDPIRIPVL